MVLCHVDPGMQCLLMFVLVHFTRLQQGLCTCSLQYGILQDKLLFAANPFVHKDYRLAGLL